MSFANPHAATHPPSIPGLDFQGPIGEGGMSVVYKAVHRNLHRIVAVKVLRAVPDEGGAGPTWLREPRLMASLAHPHVVVVHDAGQSGGQNYLVMEYMAGGSLRARMAPGRPWSLAEAVPLLECVARALESIHGLGVLHLDLKPENILYTADGQAKVTDFGLSLPRADAGGLLSGLRFRGTLDYCAPEYRAGLALDSRYDVFSLATMAYELLTGRVPGRVYLPASRFNPHLPPALDEVLRRGLARDPDDRYPSVAAFRQALRGAYHPTARRVSPRLLSALAGLVVAALVIVAVVAYQWRGDPRQPDGLPTPESSGLPAPALNRPDRLVLLYDKPEDLSLFAGEGGGALTSGSDVAVEPVLAEAPLRSLPAGLPLPVWPTPRPALVIHSPRTWGFVHPLKDQSLAQRVVKHWPELLRVAVSPQTNFVQAGGFDGDCLAKNHGGALWRVGDTSDWSATRRITLDRSQGESGNTALLLTNLDPGHSKRLLGCYQPLAQGPPPGAVVVLRFRARSLHGKGSLAVYVGLPAVIPEGETGAAATRVRSLATPLPPEPGDAQPNRWLYRSPAWVTPTAEWQTYLVVTECPPFPTQALHRNLVIDLTASPPTAIDQVWVDDVELFVWPPRGKP